MCYNRLMSKTLFLSIVAAFAVFLSSCATQVTGILQADGSAGLDISAALQPRIAALVNGFSMAAGMAPGTPLLDASAVSASLSAAAGIESAQLSNSSPVAIGGHISVSQIGSFLASGNTDFITFTQEPSGGGRFTAALNRSNAGEVLNMVSPDVVSYLSALMAPIATGEVMSRDDYMSIVASVYGQEVAVEMENTTIRISIDFPGTVTGAKGGTFSGKKVQFDIPLLDVLVMEEPLSYEASWR